MIAGMAGILPLADKDARTVLCLKAATRLASEEGGRGRVESHNARSHKTQSLVVFTCVGDGLKVCTC